MTMAAAPTPRAFDPAHPDLEAFAGIPTASGERRTQQRLALPSWAKLGLTIVLGGALLISALVLVLAPAYALAILPTLGFGVLVLLFLLVFVAQLSANRTVSPGEASREALLTRFAADNGLLYRPRSPAPAYPGCIFTPMNTGLAYVYNHFSTTSGRYLDFGNFHSRSTTGDGPGGHVDPDPLIDSWGFVALQMDQQLPGILLIANNRVGGQTVLPIRPDRSQVLSLEGNFDNYFTLYCPKEFEQDALYIFTPDLMALLIDEVAPFDVEIIDKWMFLYLPRPFDSTDPAVYERIFRILNTVGTKIVGQTSHYNSPVLAAAPAAAPAATGWHWEWNPALVPGRTPAGSLRPTSQLVGLIVTVSVVVVVFVGVIIWGIASGRAHFG
jgi:hypothetical protein